MNPYAPSDPPNETETPEKPARRFWPPLALNIAFLLCIIAAIVLPGLISWGVVSLLTVLSVGGWALSKSMQQN